MKKLTQDLEDKLFELHKGCWMGNGDNRAIRSYGVTLYAIEISTLYKQGYDVREHVRFASYYRKMLYPRECDIVKLLQGGKNGQEENKKEIQKSR